LDRRLAGPQSRSRGGGEEAIEMNKKFRPEKLTGRDHSKDLGVDGRIILQWNLGKQGGKVWTEYIWLRTGTSEGFL
jgi:hypothetical protein